MLVTVVVHLKGYYEETSPARSSHHQIPPPLEMGLVCGQLRSVKHAQQINSFFHSGSKIVHIYFSP